MHATITTAARRIVRTAREHCAAHTAFFAADGTLVATAYGPGEFGPARSDYAIAVDASFTQQQVADLLADYAEATARIADGTNSMAGVDGEMGLIAHGRDLDLAL